MNSDLDRDHLLNGVLGEAAPPAFRSRLLEEALQQVRYRKRLGQLRRGAVAAVCLLVAGFLALEGGRRSTKANRLLVHSRPLSSAVVVHSRPDSVAAVKPADFELAFVRSSTETYRVLGDEELLGLLAGRPAALVRRGPFEAELVFVNPGDREGFPLR